jgi:tetratricopeptide (TPR) repeat protein
MAKKIKKHTSSLRHLKKAKPGAASQGQNLRQGLLQQAQALQQAGRLVEAESIYRQILQADPSHYIALHSLGMLVHQVGQHEAAVELIRRAIALKPDYLEAYYNLGILLYSLGRLEEAEASFRRVLTLKRDFAGAHNNLGIVLQAQGKLEEAADSYSRALSLLPKYAEAHNNLGNILHALGKPAEAEACYRRALSLMPEYVEAHTNLGIELQSQGRREEAADSYRRALALKPDHVDALNNLGMILKDQGMLDEAIARFHRVLALQPKFTEVYYNLGNALKDDGKLDEAVATYRQALILKPDYAEVYNNLGGTLKDLGKLDEAVASYRQALTLRPDYAKAHNNLGIALNAQDKLDEAAASYNRAIDLQPDYAEAYYNLGLLFIELGKAEEARSCFRQTLTIKPDYVRAYKGLSSITKFTEVDDVIRVMEDLYNEKEKMSDEDRIDLGFVLGKVFEDLRDYDKSFDFILKANQLKRRTFNYSRQDENNFFERIKKTFSPSFFAAHADIGYQERTPIFIVGMPRSGTTLVEQILASHPLVHGAGELDLLSEVIASICCTGRIEDQFPECMLDCDPSCFERMGPAYIEKIRQYSIDAVHITDKMPGNFLRVGVIKTILPNAKVIHCVRNPMATCFSIFKNDFTGIHGYAYDMDELGRYYNLYHDLMVHWAKVLPGFMYTVKYEELVAEQQTQTKSLLDFCGLAWDDACLFFHKTARKVDTASHAQVRQPLYKDSIDLWKRYEKHLELLREAIFGGNFCPTKC